MVNYSTFHHTCIRQTIIIVQTAVYNMSRLIFITALVVVGLSVNNASFCEDWTLCQRVRCAAPPNPCPADKPYLLYGECGCCQYCSETPRTGPCGTCGVDVVCKEGYPICHKENTTVSLDYCGCCRVCKQIVGIGGKCDNEGWSVTVCDAGLKCIHGTCSQLV